MRIAGNSVGIDYHEKTLQVCITSPEGKVLHNRGIANEVEHVVDVLQRYEPISSVVAEACTGSANFLDRLHVRTGHEVKLCHPGYAQRMKHNPDKTDFSDSELLSDLNRVGYLPQVWLAPEGIRDMRTLIRYRQQIVQRKKDTKLRVRAILRHHGIKIPAEISIWSKRGVAWLQTLTDLPQHASWILTEHLEELGVCATKLKRCEQRFCVVAERDQVIQQLVRYDGIGLVTAVVMRAEIGWFSRFRKGKQLARFCGATPRNASTGAKHADAGLIRAGNPLLKSVIIEAAHRIIRHDQYWKEFAQKLRQDGKKAPVIVAAVANRWLRRLHHVMCKYEKFSN